MSELRNYILSKASEALLEFDARAVLGQINKGVTGIGTAGGWDRPKPKAPVKPKKPPKPLAGKYVGKPKPPVTEWKTRIAQILADKIDEIILSDPRKQKTIDPAEFLKKQRVQAAAQAAAKFANKPMPKINTDVDVSQYLPEPKTATKSDAVRMSNKSKVESTNLKDRMVDMLLENSGSLEKYWKKNFPNRLPIPKKVPKSGDWIDRAQSEEDRNEIAGMVRRQRSSDAYKKKPRPPEQEPDEKPRSFTGLLGKLGMGFDKR